MRLSTLKKDLEPFISVPVDYFKIFRLSSSGESEYYNCLTEQLNSYEEYTHTHTYTLFDFLMCDIGDVRIENFGKMNSSQLLISTILAGMRLVGEKKEKATVK